MSAVSFCIIGASRGLGRAISLRIAAYSPQKLVLIARTGSELKSLAQEIAQICSSTQVETLALDLTQETDFHRLQSVLRTQHLDALIYCAGGGNHGSYSNIKWSSHQWTLKLNLLVPAELLHSLLGQENPPQSIVIVGSALADQLPEPLGVSYAAAKSGLRALVTSIQADPQCPSQVHLFRPGFLDTKMIPAGSWPRKSPEILQSTEQAAERLLKKLFEAV